MAGRWPMRSVARGISERLRQPAPAAQDPEAHQGPPRTLSDTPPTTTKDALSAHAWLTERMAPEHEEPR
jgi:hypothetical protein